MVFFPERVELQFDCHFELIMNGKNNFSARADGGDLVLFYIFITNF